MCKSSKYQQVERQQIEAGDFIPLFIPGKPPSGVLCPVLQGRFGLKAVSPVQNQKDD